jgi:hypothetical protein
MARKLLVWWEATNHPDDEDSGLARDTRKFLWKFADVEVPDFTDSALDYANCEDEEPSQLPPQPGRSDTTALSLAHELHHAQLRRIDGDALPDDHHRSNDSNPRTDDDSSSQCACRSQE